MQIVSNSVAETEAFAGEWLQKLLKESDRERVGATIVGLSGHLGAGKTAFVKAVAKKLGIEEEITSPTFVIMKIYSIRGELNLPWRRLVHIDAYRLEQPEEMEAIRFEEAVSDGQNLIMIEWPEQVSLEKLVEYKKVSFEMKDGACTITY